MNDRTMRIVTALAVAAAVMLGAVAGCAPRDPGGGELPRLVALGTGDCKACLDLAPILDELAREYDGRLVIEEINVYARPSAYEEFALQALPTQVLFTADGREVWRHEGFAPRDELIAALADAVGVD